MSTTLKGVGIGAGYFSRYHYDAWNRMDGVTIAAICDLNLEKAKEVGDTWNIPTVYSDPEIMFEREKPDFVDIITPPETHYELVKMAADRNIAVICQKPMAPTYEEAESIVSYTSSLGVRFMVHENWRFQPWYRKMRQMIEDGEIGKHLHTIYSRMRTGDGWQNKAYLDRQPYFRSMPRLLIYETGIHFIDTFQYLGGPISSVYAQLRKWNKQIKGEDAGMVHFNFESGALGLYDGNRYNESVYENNRYTFGDFAIEGSRGTVRLDGKGNLTLQKLGEPIESVVYKKARRGFAGDCVHVTQRHFIDGLLNDKPFETSGPNYLRSLKVQEAVYESALKNKMIKVGAERLKTNL